jgi:hypothetical protein
MNDTAKVDRAEENARGWLEEMTRMVAAANDATNDETTEAASEEIAESVLACETYRSFEILLTTGGPALRIVGTLDTHCEPEGVELQKQDWGTPWTRVALTGAEQETVERFASHFYFGEGE